MHSYTRCYLYSLLSTQDTSLSDINMMQLRRRHPAHWNMTSGKKGLRGSRAPRPPRLAAINPRGATSERLHSQSKHISSDPTIRYILATVTIYLQYHRLPAAPQVDQASIDVRLQALSSFHNFVRLAKSGKDENKRQMAADAMSV